MTAPLFGAPDPAPPAPPVTYLPDWLPEHVATMAWCERHLPWEHRDFRDGVKMPRLECWMGPAGATYTYSGVRYRARDLSRHPVRKLVDRVNEATGQRFNALFANLYRDGRDSIGWHADDEPSLGPVADVVIASLSLGARRRFAMKHVESGTKAEWKLGAGDLLVMGAGCQDGWVHAVPKTTWPVGPRVALTFRRLP